MSKVSVKHFELLTQGNYTFKQKMHKMYLLLSWKSERRKNNCYLVLGDKNIKNEEFLFSKQNEYSEHGWLLHRKPMLYSRSLKITGGLQSNRVNCWL